MLAVPHVSYGVYYVLVSVNMAPWDNGYEYIYIYIYVYTYIWSPPKIHSCSVLKPLLPNFQELSCFQISTGTAPRL